jgi:hypothetical protein
MLWNKILLETLAVTQLVKKFPLCYGTQTFITVFTSYLEYKKGLNMKVGGEIT